MAMRLQVDEWGAVRQWADELGPVALPDAAAADMVAPLFRLLRYDDAWRPLGAAGQPSLVAGLAEGSSDVTFRGTYGGERGYAYGASPARPFPAHWPAAFDAWPYAGDIRPHAPMTFSGRLQASTARALDATGVRFTLTINDLRPPSTPGTQGVIRLPVGVELPLPAAGWCYGTAEMFESYRQLEHRLDDPALQRAWYYLEGELFGMRAPRPEAESYARPALAGDALHAGSPLAAFSGDGRTWWAVASEADYGAAALWGQQRLRYFTTLYLPPGGTASWSWVLWRSEVREPARLLLQCTREGGWFDQLNPRTFRPLGPPPGPVVFANVSRLPAQMAEIRALQPGLVLLNYHYDHVSSTANLYGEWTTYEGFAFSEARLKGIIADLRTAGVPQVGIYGSQIEQPESHRALRQEDIVLDAWGRRFHAWEPGNWVIDAGNGDCGERLARAEAEFCRHYGFDATFEDRLDHVGVNHNPARVGKAGDARLALIPSLRLGMIEHNKQRMAWMRRLNPHLRVGLNNTTGWSGVRYSDWNYLEGGNHGNRDLPRLQQPAGVMDLRHTTPLFGPPSGADLFQAIGAKPDRDSFPAIMRRYIGESLFGGGEASPYGDEWFVDPQSMFFNGHNSKYDPDPVKQARIDAVPWAGGAAWRALWLAVQPALAASLALATPPARVTSRPDAGTLPPDCTLHARAGDAGGIFVALRNRGTAPVTVHFSFHGYALAGELPPDAVRVWWAASPATGITTLLHLLGAPGS